MDHTIYTSNGNKIRRSSLGKKIKKASNTLFSVFASTPPGFSEFAESEARQKLKGIKNLHRTKGGISFQTEVKGIKDANLHLGIPSRILVRLGKFRAENFDILMKKLLDIPFELFLFKDAGINVHATCRKSRLIHSGAVEERVEISVKKRLEQNESALSRGKIENPRIFIRISNDMATISMDSSGDPLYKRGIKKYISSAPIRENLACASIFRSGYKPKSPFFDPMCGSGTFSIEAALMATSTPPGKFRNFAFEGWPIYILMDNSSDSSLPSLEKGKTQSIIFASDLNPENIFLLKRNLEPTGLSEAVSKACADFFTLKPAKEKGTIALNPPYGIRIEKEKGLIPMIAKNLKKNFRGWNLILTIPVDMGSNYFSVKNFDKTSFIHGGIDMMLLTGKIP